MSIPMQVITPVTNNGYNFDMLSTQPTIPIIVGQPVNQNVVSPSATVIVPVYTKAGVSIVFSVLERKHPSVTLLQAIFTNDSLVEVTEFELKVAVPKVCVVIRYMFIVKYCLVHIITLFALSFFPYLFFGLQYLTLQLESASGAVLKANGGNRVTQNISITNTMHGQVCYAFLYFS